MEYADLNTLRNGGYTLRHRRNQRDTATTNQLKLRTWNNELGQIEGKCGAAVTNYFIFLRRLLLLNTFVCVLSFAFYVLPYIIVESKATQVNSTKPSCENEETNEIGIIEGILLFTAGKGALGQSPLFYTFYETTEPSIPVCISYIFGTVVIFTFTLVSISISASQSIKVSIKNTGGAQEGLLFRSKTRLLGTLLVNSQSFSSFQR